MTDPRHPRHRAFTLTELVIVIMILAILAAFAIPKFTNASAQARASALANDLRNIRDQLNRYKFEHNEIWPDLVADQWAPMTQRSDRNGTVNPAGEVGPYLLKPPANPFTESSVIAAAEIAGNGFVYEINFGDFYAVGFDDDTQTYTAP